MQGTDRQAGDGGPGTAGVAAGRRTERREQVLTQETASVVGGISDAVVAKAGEPFFLCPPDGQIPCADGYGYGLYHHDCRFLGGYELRLGGRRPNSLASTEAEGSRIVLELTNPDLTTGDGTQLAKEQLGITWSRCVNEVTPALEETIDIRNYGRHDVRLPLELRFDARFEDVFLIRGLLDKLPGERQEPGWEDDRLRFSYRGADGIDRLLRVAFDRQPDARRNDGAEFDVVLQPRGRFTLRVTAAIEERTRGDAKPIERRESPAEAWHDVSTGSSRPPREGWVGGGAWPTSVRTSSLALDATLDRSFKDLQMLRARLDGDRYYEAGIPWFATLFGRDALLTALQTIAFDAAPAADTLRLLARRQGTRVDEWRDEAPGKILHELRIGELARLGEIPHTPYYGTVDATPLFLVLVGEHARWTGRLDLFDELREAIEGALGWLDDHGDSDGDGFIDYRSRTERGLVNQGWKDSGNAIVTADGNIAEPPIALVEVQAYAYRAWLEMASLFERAGDGGRAAELQRRAHDLRDRFEQAFWSDELGCYHLALASGEPCEVVTSNAGHVLWSGLPGRDRARAVGERLLRSDMFNGWGIRTLSSKAAAYHPIGYHLGTVWPHDNALIAAGLRRYGLDEQAEQVLLGMTEAAQDFPNARLPECFSGYERARFGIPVRYPVACHPQAWAAGSIPSLLVSSLGLTPEAFDRRLRVVRPRLPPFVEEVEVSGLAVGDARAHLRFERRDGETHVDVVDVEGQLEVQVDTVAPGQGDEPGGARDG